MVHEHAQEHRSAGGIHIPSTVGEKHARIGTVVAKGPDVSGDIQVGDTVIFDRFHKRHMVDGRMCKIMNEGDVFMVVEPDEAAS